MIPAYFIFSFNYSTRSSGWLKNEISLCMKTKAVDENRYPKKFGCEFQCIGVKCHTNITAYAGRKS